MQKWIVLRVSAESLWKPAGMPGAPFSIGELDLKAYKWIYRFGTRLRSQSLWYRHMYCRRHTQHGGAERQSLYQLSGADDIITHRAVIAADAAKAKAAAGTSALVSGKSGNVKRRRDNCQQKQRNKQQKEYFSSHCAFFANMSHANASPHRSRQNFRVLSQCTWIMIQLCEIRMNINWHFTESRLVHHSGIIFLIIIHEHFTSVKRRAAMVKNVTICSNPRFASQSRSLRRKSPVCFRAAAPEKDCGFLDLHQFF